MRNKELTPRYESLAGDIERLLGGRVTRLPTSTGELGYEIAPADLIACCEILRDDESTRFDMLMDVAGVDYLEYGRDEWQVEGATGIGFSRGVLREVPDFDQGDFAPVEYAAKGRFAVAYHLLSITHNRRLRLKTFPENEQTPIVDSVTEVWASANWFEREAFDLYGILFRGHPDLRRILTDYGFIGHPFRKDFPLIGQVEMRFDPEQGRIVYEPVSIEPRTLVPKVIRDDNRYEPDLKDTGDA